MKLSELLEIAPNAWKLSDIKNTVQDIPYRVERRTSSTHYFIVRGDDKPPEHHYSPDGYMICIGSWREMWIVFESFDDMPIWAQERWRQYSRVESS